MIANHKERTYINIKRLFNSKTELKKKRAIYLDHNEIENKGK